MTTATAAPTTGQLLGYARVSTGHQSLDAQTDALTAAGVDPARVYSDKLTGTSTKEQRAGLAAVLDYARPGDTIVVVGIDRLGRDACEVMLTIRDLGERGIVLRSLREGIDTSNATGRMIAGVLASLAELELELGRERRAAAREARRARGHAINDPRRSTNPRPHARGARTPAVNRSRRSLPRLPSAVRRCIACWPNPNSGNRDHEFSSHTDLWRSWGSARHIHARHIQTAQA